jgi:hypothetical protein
VVGGGSKRTGCRVSSTSFLSEAPSDPVQPSQLTASGSHIKIKDKAFDSINQSNITPKDGII